MPPVPFASHIEAALLQAIVSGLVGGAAAGLAALAAIRVELKWHRQDIDRAHKRIDQLEHAHARAGDNVARIHQRKTD